MTIATKLNDIIALSQNIRETPTSSVLTDEELSLVVGGGNSPFASSDQAYEAQRAAEARFNGAVQDTIEAVGNLELGSATRHANDAYNAYGEVQAARENLNRAVDSDVANLSAQHDIDRQIANGHNYSPMDANMSNRDGSPGIGY